MNILFFAFEGEARLMAELARLFKKNGHGVFVVSCDHFNVTHTRGEVFDYYRSTGLQENEFANMADVFRKLNSLPPELSRDLIDWNYLEDFEIKYCRRFTLLELAAMDPLMSDVSHNRNIYYRPENKNIFFKYLELQCRWLEGIFSRRVFDVAFTINFQYFIKAAAFTMAEAKGIPFLMVGTCRISDLHLLFDNFSLGTPRAVADEMERLSESNNPCRDAAEYIDWLKKERQSAYTGFLDTMRIIKDRMSLTPRLMELWCMITRYPRHAIFINKHYRGMFRRNYFLPNYFATLFTMIAALSRRIGYFRYRQLTRTDLPKGPFVYFPLHLIPENSVLTLSKTFNELECLFQLSKSLPINWKVVVKINPYMLIDLDSHPNRYYLEMSRLPNVQFISPLVPSFDIIEKASAVACISGTALLEAAILDKPCFRWGRTEFEAIDTVFEFCSDKVRERIGMSRSSNLKYYIQACFNLGLHLDFRLLCHPVSPVSPRLSAEQAEEYQRQLTLLEEEILHYCEASIKLPV